MSSKQFEFKMFTLYKLITTNIFNYHTNMGDKQVIQQNQMQSLTEDIFAVTGNRVFILIDS